MSSMGSRLKEARKLRHLSQEALAEKIGTSRGVITNIEHNKVQEPQAMVVNAICHALEIRPQWLLEGQEPIEIEKEPLPLKGGGSESEPEKSELTEEINAWVQGLPTNDQLYILETIKAYVAHRNR